MYSKLNPAWGSMMQQKERHAEQERRETETARASAIKAENPGITWGEALQRATRTAIAKATD